jgi:hypothetical protein
MARGRKKSEKTASAATQQLIYEALLRADGGVIRAGPPIDNARAIVIRQRDGNVVVCGPDKTANSLMARDIEQAASGHWKRCNPHINAGPNALPHYQPDPRGNTVGHTFYETKTKHPVTKK